MAIQSGGGEGACRTHCVLPKPFLAPWLYLLTFTPRFEHTWRDWVPRGLSFSAEGSGFCSVERVTLVAYRAFSF